MARVLILSFTDLASDPRVDRQIAALRDRHEIVAAGLSRPRRDVDEYVELTLLRRGYSRMFTPVELMTRRFEHVYWHHPTNRAALRRLASVHSDIIVANDIPALPVALRLGSPVVLDAHEYSPREISDRLWWRALFAPYVTWLCRHYVPEVAAMTTVGPVIADRYERLTGVHATVVTNAPPRADLAPTPLHSPIRVLHHGLAQRGRGLEEMLQVAELLDARFRVDFILVEQRRGYRDELIRRSRANPRIRFLPPVPMHDLVNMANEYDIGLYLLPPLNFNQRYALPNKFFEFIQGRLAVAIGPSPEMARIVRQYGCGVVTDDFAPESMARALNSLDAQSIAEFKRSSHGAADELNAELNAELILDAVEQALKMGSGALAR